MSQDKQALRKKLCKNNQPQKNDFVVRAADRSLSFLFQYKLNTAVCQAPMQNILMQRSEIRVFCGASVQPVWIHYLKLTEHFAPVPKQYYLFLDISVVAGYKAFLLILDRSIDEIDR